MQAIAVKETTHNGSKIKFGSLTVKLTREEWLDLLGEMTVTEQGLQDRTDPGFRFRKMMYARDAIGVPA